MYTNTKFWTMTPYEYKGGIAYMVYVDENGQWGVENNEWCIIKKDKKEKKEEITSKLIRTCKGEKIGYPCCQKKEKVIYYI